MEKDFSSKEYYASIGENLIIYQLTTQLRFLSIVLKVKNGKFICKTILYPVIHLPSHSCFSQQPHQ